MDIPSDTLGLVLEVLIFKFDSCLAGIRYHKKIQPQQEQGNKGRGKDIWHHHPVKTYSAGKDCDDLGVRCHLRRKENDRDKDEKRTEHVHEIWNKVQIIIKNDSPQRSLLLDKVIYPLADVEDNDDADDQQKCHEERGYEFPDDIYVNLSWSEIKLHFYTKVLLLSYVRSHPSMP